MSFGEDMRHENLANDKFFATKNIYLRHKNLAANRAATWPAANLATHSLSFAHIAILYYFLYSYVLTKLKQIIFLFIIKHR